MRVLFHAFIRRGQPVFEDAMAGQISMEEMYIFRFRQAAADFGQTVSRQEALDFQTAYQWQQNHIQLSPALEKLLALCREREAFLGVITNGPVSAPAGQMQGPGAFPLDRGKSIFWPQATSASTNRIPAFSGKPCCAGSWTRRPPGTPAIPMTTISVELPGPAGIPSGWTAPEQMNRKSLRPTSE